MTAAFGRLALISGGGALEALAKTRVMIFGLGGVGSWCAEALVRSGIGHLTLVDSDMVCVTNINRQVQALPSTIGAYKTDALRDRLTLINPLCTIIARAAVFNEEHKDEFAIDQTDYVIDAIDSLSCKIALIETADKMRKTLFSSMGMAQKLDPTQIRAVDIWQTHGCALARLVRAALRKRKFTGHFTAVYSAEHLPIRSGISITCGGEHCMCPPGRSGAAREWCRSKKIINGSAVVVTAAAGMTLASLVLRDVTARYE